jgi:acetoin utilization deacetylase AcuC-like enzyme
MSQYDVPVVWSPETRLHDPRGEVWVGVPTVGTETAERVDAVLSALSGHRLIELPQASSSSSFLDEGLLQVHTAELVDFLRIAAGRWAEGPYEALVGQDRVVPYFFPTPAMTAGLPAQPAMAVHADAGRFGYDTMTLVGPGTWEAARAAAGCAVEAARLVAAGERVAYALCRPPGHHATPAGYGGSCYLNNAAVAAVRLRDAGFTRVGIVDVDAHHGNGTAAIFYAREDVLYGSVHVDPAHGWFPHVVGHASETGIGSGSGTTRNLPLPPETGDAEWLAAVASLADWVVSAGCEALVVSLGVDAAAEDPESPLRVSEDGFRQAGLLLGETSLPAVVVQEGGYHLPTLGLLVAAYLDGHAEGVSP